LPVLTLELEGVDGLEGLAAVVGELALVVGVDDDLEELPHAAIANPAKAIAATDIRRFNGHLAGIGRLVVRSGASTPRPTSWSGRAGLPASARPAKHPLHRRP
jgi:hypothetical protein